MVLQYFGADEARSNYVPAKLITTNVAAWSAASNR